MDKANEIRREKGFVDVVNLARDFDVEVVSVSRPFENYNAQITYDKGTKKYVMHVNEAHSVERQRFSIAHELGHLALHNKQLAQLGKLERSGASETEREADEFAAQLLMPEQGVRDYLTTVGIDPKCTIDVSVVKRLANQFRVSKQVAIIRLRELGFYVPFIQFA